MAGLVKAIRKVERGENRRGRRWSWLAVKLRAVNFASGGFCNRLHEATSSTPDAQLPSKLARQRRMKLAGNLPSPVSVRVWQWWKPEYRPISNKNYLPPVNHASSTFQRAYKRARFENIDWSSLGRTRVGASGVHAVWKRSNEFRKRFREKLWTHFRIG